MSSPAGRPGQASLRRIEDFGIRPKRVHGQNFLIDDNILRVTEREARLDPSDIVLEVGAGLGTLTEFLAERVRWVHAFEVDRDLAPALEDAVGALANVDLEFSDALDADLRRLQPAPTKLVANLPYSVAVPVLARCAIELDTVGLVCVMVQREIAERLAASPGSKVYGIPSVIAQLAFEVEIVHRVSPAVFVPRPRVWSALVRLTRIRNFPDPSLRDFVASVFAHRRKTLVRSLTIALHDRPSLGFAAAGPDAILDLVRIELKRMRKPQNIRAEALSPSELETLWRAAVSDGAPAGS